MFVIDTPVRGLVLHRLATRCLVVHTVTPESKSRLLPVHVLSDDLINCKGSQTVSAWHACAIAMSSHMIVGRLI